MAECRKPSSLECPICFENMIPRQPRFLRCHHSFCEACLLGIASSNEKRDIICPTCRYKTPIYKGGVTQLPLDFTLQGMKEELQRSRGRCDVCMCRDVTVDASYRCLDCNQQFCEDCLLLHIDRYSSHSSIPIIAKGVNCAQHEQVVRYFCRTCSKYLCPLCAFDSSSEHQRHQVSPLSKEFDSFRIEFYNMRRSSETIKENIQQYKNTMEESMQQLTTRTDVIKELIGNVDSVNDITQKLLESEMKDVKGLLAADKLEICTEIGKQIRGISRDIEKMKTTLDKCDSIINQCACSLKRLKEATGSMANLLENFNGRLQENTTSLEHLKEATSSMEDRLDIFSERMSDNTTSIDKLKETTGSMENCLEHFDGRLHDNTTSLRNLKEATSSMEDSLDFFSGRLHDHTTSINKLQETTGFMKNRLEHFHGRLHDNTTSLKNLKKTMEDRLEHFGWRLSDHTKAVEDLKNKIQEQTNLLYVTLVSCICLIGVLCFFYTRFIIIKND